MTPLLPKELEEVIVKSEPDPWFVGSWQLLNQFRVYIDAKGNTVEKSLNYKGNIKVYKTDKSFFISSHGRIVLKGNYIALNNQVRENVITSSGQGLDGISNVLYYSISDDKKR